MRKILLVFVLLLAFLTPVSAQVKKIELKGLLTEVKEISSPVFSPDGNRLAFVLSNYNLENNKNIRNIWVMDCDGNNLKQLTNSDRDSSPCWSKDGSKIAFLSSRKDKSQIWLIDTGGGEASQITDISTGVSSFEWSADNKFFTFMSYVNFNAGDDQEQKKIAEAEKKLPTKAKIYKNLGYRTGAGYLNGLRSHLYSVNLTDKKINKITAESEKELFTESYAISADGKSIARVLTGNPVTYIAREACEAPLGGSGQKVPVSGKEQFVSSVKYSPDGKFISYVQWDGNQVNSSRLVIYNRKLKTAKNLTADFKYAVYSYFWSPNSEQLYFRVGKGTKTALYKCDVSSGKIKNLTGGFFGSGFDISPDGKKIVFIKSSLNSPREIFIMAADGKNIRQISGFNKKFTDTYKLRAAEHFTFAGANGSSVEGMLIFSPDFDPAKKYPLLLWIHGGPHSAFHDVFESNFANPQLYSAKGYIVAQINIRGSVGYGQDFVNEVINNYGGLPYEDLMKGVDYLLTGYSFIDKDRLAVMGHSYGGYMTNWIVGHTDRFKCAVTMASIYNTFSHQGTCDLKWFYDIDFCGKPWENREIYEKWSPHNYAGNFKTPTFVIHGELDYRVPVTEGMQMFSALQQQGVESQLMILPDEDHGLSMPSSQIFIFDETVKWLDRWCK